MLPDAQIILGSPGLSSGASEYTNVKRDEEASLTPHTRCDIMPYPMRARKQVLMRVTEKKRVTVPAQRRRAGVGSVKRGTGVANPFRKLRGVGLQRIDVDRYLVSVRGR